MEIDFKKINEQLNTNRKDKEMGKVVVKLKNGLTGYLVNDIHVMFDNDSYSHTVPIEDVVEIRKEEK